METKTYEDDKVTRSAAGPHKLAHEFSVEIMIDGELMPNGKMDMKKMNGQGVLKNGTHVHGTLKKFIDAEVRPVELPDGTQTLAITIQATDLSAVYQGVLLRDENGKLALGGFYKFDTSLPQMLELPMPEPAQDEGVWVITKP